MKELHYVDVICMLSQRNKFKSYDIYETIVNAD